VTWDADGLPLAVLAVAPEIAAIVRPDLTPLFVNPAFVACWDVYPEEPLDQFHVHPADRTRLQDLLRRAAHSRSATTFATETRLGSEERWAHALLRIAAVPELPDTLIIHALDAVSGLAPQHARSMSWDNALGLPGRTCLLQHLDQLHSGSLILCDMDNFHLVNASLGHDKGNIALAALANRFLTAMHDGDLLCWLGADEFAIVCDHRDEDPKKLADSLRRAAHQPVDVGEDRYVITGSFGIAPTTPGVTTLDLLASAEAALFMAKEQGRDRVEVFDEGLRVTAIQTLKRMSELRQAAARHELSLYFQPIVDLGTNQMVGCEGLLRWVHPRDGVLAPGHFMHMAESSGLMNELTPRLLQEAVKAACMLRASASDPPFVAVNISASQLALPYLGRYVEQVLEWAELPADRLIIEITETAVLTDLDEAQRILNRFRKQGIGVALDDFGTGYSSLLNLRRLPVSKLKIDRSFVRGCLHDPDDLAIVASVVDLAAKLGIDCVAEGVETVEQAALLHELGCLAAQGFLWSPAVPIGDLVQGLPTRLEVPSADAADPETTALILQMHNRGASLNAITAALDGRGCKTRRGRRWRPHVVAQVIAATRYPDLPHGRHGQTAPRPSKAG
jgi:diguanylate cyclase (GGDEF)-like protein